MTEETDFIMDVSIILGQFRRYFEIQRTKPTETMLLATINTNIFFCKAEYQG